MRRCWPPRLTGTGRARPQEIHRDSSTDRRTRPRHRRRTGDSTTQLSQRGRRNRTFRLANCDIPAFAVALVRPHMPSAIRMMPSSVNAILRKPKNQPPLALIGLLHFTSRIPIRFSVLNSSWLRGSGMNLTMMTNPRVGGYRLSVCPSPSAIRHHGAFSVRPHKLDPQKTEPNSTNA